MSRHALRPRRELLVSLCRFRSLSDKSKLVRFSAVLYVLFLYSIVLEQMGLPVSVARAGLAVVLLSLLPGMLCIALLGVRLDRIEALGYAVATSLSLTMTINLVLNQLYIRFGSWPVFPAPYNFSMQLLSISILIGGLLVAVSLSGIDPELPNVSLPGELPPKSVLVVLQVPLWTVTGATLINQNMMNSVLLGVLAVIAVVPLLIIGVEKKYHLIILWTVGISLLFQNTVISRFLRGGDGQYEFYFANLTLVRGFWEPSIPRTMNALVRLTISHPSFAVLGNIELMTVFTVVNPLLFSVIAIVLYKVYEREFDAQVALFGVLLYMFLHPFFTTLARNTRTSTGLLFLAVLILAFVDEELSRRAYLGIAAISMISIVFSHHGTALILAALLVFAAVFEVLGTKIPENVSSLYIPASLLGIGLFIWYGFTTSGLTFAIIGRVLIRDVLFGFDQFLSTESTAAQAAATDTESITYTFIQIEFIILMICMSVGVFITTISRLLQKWGYEIQRLREFESDQNVLYQLFSIGSVGILVVAFAPVSIFGIGRVIMIATLCLAPYGILTIRSSFELFSKRPVAPPVIATILAIILIFNSGLVATAILEERSPQPNIDRERIVTDGTDWEKYHLFARYTTESDYRSAQWLRNFKSEEDPIYGAGFQFTGGISLTIEEESARKPPGVYYALTSETVAQEQGYIYLTEYTVRTGKNVPMLRVKSSNFQTIRLESINGYGIEYTNQVYTNGFSRNYRMVDDMQRFE